MRKQTTLTGLALVPALLVGSDGPGYAATPSVPIDGLQFAGIVELVEDGVANLTIEPVYTVPQNRVLVITDVVMTNNNAGAACCQVVLRNDAPATTQLTVPAKNNFTQSFTTGLVFGSGQTVKVQNGDTVGRINFYLRGMLLQPKN